jgi:hypothetical protein
LYAVSATTGPRAYVTALLAVSFAVNWVWEVAQMAAYAPAEGRSRAEEFLVCTLAAVGDAALTLLVFAAAAIVKRPRRWVWDGGRKAYGAAALAGGALAVLIEWAALAAGYWSYAPGMPRVPGAGVGLLPFLQLTLLVPLSLWGAARLVARVSGKSSYD